MEQREEVIADLRQNDPSITDVDIELLDFSDDVRSISEALQANDHVNTLVLDFRWLGRSYDNWDSLLGVIATRENLGKIKLTDTVDVMLRNPFDRIVPFLLAIQQNPRVQTVTFDHVQISGDLMARFLDTATPIRELQFDSCHVEAPTDALAIAAALQRNTNIKLLILWALDEVFIVPLLNSLASEESKLQSLVLASCSVHRREQESFRSAIVGVLQPHSLLRSLELDHSGGFETAEDFARLFASVEQSPLESFTIARINSTESCLALITSIPNMQLMTLEVILNGDLQYMKRDLIGAVKRNASLRTVVARGDYFDDWLDNDDRMKLISYSTRNEFLAQWSENPTVVPITVWLEALLVARTTGPGTVFHILRTLVPFLWTSEE
jgi:hypothetical protein